MRKKPSRRGSVTKAATVATQGRVPPRAEPTPEPTPTQTVHTDRLCDGLKLWEAEAESGSPPLSPIHIGTSERFLILFTISMVRCDLHFLDFPTYRDCVRCRRRNCLLCRIGQRSQRRDLLPAYDFIEKEVGVLPISLDLHPQALRSQLLPMLRRLRETDEPVLIAVDRSGERFNVTSLPLSEDVNDGAAVIQPFRAQLNSGEIDLAAAYPLIPDGELATVEEIGALIMIKGLAV